MFIYKNTDDRLELVDKFDTKAPSEYVFILSFTELCQFDEHEDDVFAQLKEYFQTHSVVELRASIDLPNAAIWFVEQE